MRIDVVLLSGMLTLGATAEGAGRTTKVAQTARVEEPAPAAGTDDAQPQRPAKTTVTATTTAESDKSASGIVGSAAAYRDPGDPIRLAWVEGDVAGMTSIFSPDGKSTIGFVEYRQRRSDSPGTCGQRHFYGPLPARTPEPSGGRVGSLVTAKSDRLLEENTAVRSAREVLPEPISGTPTRRTED